MKNDADIESLIRFGEDSCLEFKSVLVPGKRVSAPDDRDVADEFSAAANAAGATFLFGVDDKTRQVQGVPVDKLGVVETWLRNICNDAIKPAIPATIRKVPAHNAKGEVCCIVRVDVPRSLFVHEGPHGYFYRIGSSKRKMPPEMLARLFQQRSQSRIICFDEQIVSQAEVKNLKRDLFARFRTELSPENDLEFLRKLHFLVPDTDGRLCPTVSGVLFASEHPELYLPSAYIQAVCYRGTERNADDQLDARDIAGPLDVQVIEACRFVARNMRIAAVKNPARVDIPQFAMNAVFEAVANAVAHRDYSISGAKIRLHMFADRLELFSPGGLPNSMTLDEIGERQFARNELICTCLARCPLTESLEGVLRSRIMDRRGEGVPVIVSATRRLTRRDPVFRLLDDAELQLTIYSTPLEDKAFLRDIAGQKLVSNQKKVVSEGEKRVSTGEKLVFDGEKLVLNGEKLVLERASVPTLRKIASVRESVGDAEFGISDLVRLMPRSTAIALMSKLKQLNLIRSAEHRGRYVFRW